MKINQTKDLSFEVKELQGDSGIFSGYGSVFGVIDYSGDIVDKNAFTESLKTKKPALFWQHDSACPIGVWEEIHEDEHGLSMTGRLLIDEVEKAREAWALLKAGAISGLSIGFVPTDTKWEHDPVTGESVRHIKACTLFEVSLVSIPCCDQARVHSVKSINSIREVEEILRDSGFSRSEAKTLISAIKAQRDADKAEDETLKSAQNLLSILKS